MLWPKSVDVCPECGDEVYVWERNCFGPNPHNIYRCHNYRCVWMGTQPDIAVAEYVEIGN